MPVNHTFAPGAIHLSSGDFEPMPLEHVSVSIVFVAARTRAITSRESVGVLMTVLVAYKT